MNTPLKLITLTFVLLGISLPLSAQEPTSPSTFTSDRLEQMAAPIALYPDALVAQILMASTYPLEVVEASRWVEQNPDLAGPALEEALKLQGWDPSVKALCGFPTVLKQMNDNLSWTRDLGDAFLVQQAELMDTIQSMRLKAYEAGNLETTQQQQVIHEERIIVIQPANPEVIYVPYYSPVVVYGPSWYYPTWYYPGCYVAPRWGHSHVSFGLGFHWGWGLWGGFNWHDHGCYVDPYRFNHFNTHTNHWASHSNFPTTARNSVPWKHNPTHRAGVSYKSPHVARQFGAEPRLGRVPSGLRESEQSSQRKGVPGHELGTGRRAVTQPTDSASRSFAPRTDRGRSGAVEQKNGSGPGTSRVLRDPARSLSPSTPNRGSSSPGGDRTRGAVGGGSGRGGKSFEGGTMGRGVRSGRGEGTGARSGGSPDRGRAGGVVSGSGRSTKSFDSGAATSGARRGGSLGGAREGSVSGGGRGGRSFGGGAVSGTARSGGSVGGSRGGAVGGSGRRGGFAGGGSPGGDGSRGGGKH